MVFNNMTVEKAVSHDQRRIQASCHLCGGPPAGRGRSSTYL